jgi:sigma-B regulation protein RsbU (phosphoserine phosphatase)
LTRVADEIGRAALADMRAQMVEEALSLSGSLNLRRTVLGLLTLVRPRLGDWATVVMLDAVSGGLHLFGGNDTRYSAVVGRDGAAGTRLDRVLRTGRTELRTQEDAFSADALASMVPDAALRAQAAELISTAVLSLALTARGSTFGALVIARRDGRGFDDDEIAFAERIASRAAMALASARLYEERSLIASQLQHRMRPLVLPDVAGLRLAARYRPAAEHLDIGGDFYDVLGSGDDWLVFLGDVCGKGVEAAVLTDRTRQSIRTVAYFDRSPATVLAALNTVLLDAGADRFVTIVCARFRPSADGSHAEVDLAAAGHPAPIVLRANGFVEEVEASGTAVALRRDARYRETKVRLERGDTMLMFTDGVDEARGEDGFYGVQRLTAFLPAYAGAAPGVICEAVEQDVVEYLDGRSHDDIALLAVTCGA